MFEKDVELRASRYYSSDYPTMVGSLGPKLWRIHASKSSGCLRIHDRYLINLPLLLVSTIGARASVLLGEYECGC